MVTLGMAHYSRYRLLDDIHHMDTFDNARGDSCIQADLWRVVFIRFQTFQL